MSCHSRVFVAQVVSPDRKSSQAPVAEHVEVDLGDPGSIDAALAKIDGRFDALINVAGIPGTFPGEQVFLASPDSQSVSGTTIIADRGLFGAIAVGQVPAPAL
jgi:hypothetical protein